MSRFKVIYWKKLKNDDVCLVEFDTIDEVNDFLVKQADQYHRFMIAERKRVDKNGVQHFIIHNRGFYVSFKVITTIIEFTVLVAIFAGILFLRSWLLSINIKN